jgi:hypothetical protein
MPTTESLEDRTAGSSTVEIVEEFWSYGMRLPIMIVTAPRVATTEDKPEDR